MHERLSDKFWGKVIHSPDEQGYYGEVCDLEGVTVHTTGLLSTRTRAQAVMHIWARRQDVPND